MKKRSSTRQRLDRLAGGARRNDKETVLRKPPPASSPGLDSLYRLEQEVFGEEDMLVALGRQGLGHLVRAWLEGRTDLHRLAEYYERGRLHDLADELRHEDASLPDAIRAELCDKTPDVKPSTPPRR